MVLGFRDTKPCIIIVKLLQEIISGSRRKILLKRLEEQTNQELEKHVLFKIPFCVEDFKKEYNSYKGNAYGMANTLRQTAFLRPSIKSKKVKNLFFTGQLTVPGPGVPPALISGRIVYEQISKETLKKSVL